MLRTRSLRFWGVSLLVVVALVALVLTTCGRGRDGETEARATTTSTTITTPPTTPPPPPPTYPLTGLPLNGGAPLERPALAVKIDNSESQRYPARPQAGLNQADVVYEERVEGGVTRLAALFHSADADPIGPVRSARTTDIALLSPLARPLFAWSGANRDFAAAIRAASLIDVGHDAASGAYRRDGGRRAPNNLMSSTGGLYAAAPADVVAPPALFLYRAPGEPFGAGAKWAPGLHVEFGGGSGNAPVDWAWDAAGGGWRRTQKGTPHVDAGGVQVMPQNVIVQFVDYVDTGYRDASGAMVPEAVLVGGGTAWVFTDSQVIEGTWTKPAPEAVTQFLDPAGKPIKLTPGRTWVELAPPGLSYYPA